MNTSISKFSIFAAVAAMVLASCIKDPDSASLAAPTVTLGEASVERNSAKVSSTFSSPYGIKEKGFIISTSSDLSSGKEMQSTSMDGKSFSLTLSGLNVETVYYFQGFIRSGKMEILSEIGSFTTKDGSVPSIVLNDISNIGEYQASVSSTITDNGGIAIAQKGVCYSLEEEPTIEKDTMRYTGTNDMFLLDLTGLLPGQTYYVRSFASNSKGVGYSEQRSFITKKVPQVTTSKITGITRVKATAGGEVSDDGGEAVTSRGVCWSLEPHPTIDGLKMEQGTGTGAFTVQLVGLERGTKYYLRAYAVNATGVGYGEEITFETLSSTEYEGNLTVKTQEEVDDLIAEGFTKVKGDFVISASTLSSASRNSEDDITDIKGLLINSVEGIVVIEGQRELSDLSSISNITDISTLKVIRNKKISELNPIAKLTSLETLDLRSNAISDISPISNLSLTELYLQNNAISDISPLAGMTTLNTLVLGEGSSETNTISDVGTLLSLTNLETLSIEFLPIPPAYVKVIEEQLPSCYVNSEGVCGPEKAAPLVTTTQVSSITTSAATCGGSILSNGGDEVIVCGVCWSKNNLPTIGDSKSSDAVSDSYVSNIAGLEPGITYYVRAYATNNVGTSYGGQLEFTTVSTLPAITTKSASSISSTTAVCGGNITSLGGAQISKMGICWSTEENPTISGSNITIDSTMTEPGSFSCIMKDLTKAKKYYVRAFATNSVGTAYGDQISFTTLATKPTVTTTAVSEVTGYSAVSGGVITDNGGGEVTAAGVCWSINASPTIDLSTKTFDKPDGGHFISSVIGLTPGVTYHIRAYATNNGGTAYGEDLTFTTTTEVDPEVYIGDVILSSQEEVNAFAAQGYTKIIGNLILGSTQREWSSTYCNWIQFIDGNGGLYYSDNTSINDLAKLRLIHISGGIYLHQLKEITTLSFLSLLTHINFLSIGGCDKIKDYSQLSMLTSLQQLQFMGNNPVNDYSFLSSLTSLTYLKFENSGSINDILFLGNLTNLKALHIFGTTVTSRDFSPISRVTSLNKLYLAYNDITDISFIENLTLMDNLNLESMSITDITPIKNLKSITRLSLYNLDISDLSPIAGLTSVKTMNLCLNNIRSISPLANLTSLTELRLGEWEDVNNNTVNNITPLEKLNSLQQLWICYLPISQSQVDALKAKLPNCNIYSTGIKGSTILPPDVNTKAITAITGSTAVCGGNVTDDGGAAVTARGVCWGTTTEPVIYKNSKTSDGTGTGEFTSQLTGLLPATTYYIRSYAVNSVGTAYGPEKSFTTTCDPPTVTTDDVVGITSTGALCGGNVTSDGGGKVTARGVCWSTSPNPTVELSTKTTDGTGTGRFTSTITNLQVDTKYYVRSYAVNENGTSYGAEKTFTTKNTSGDNEDIDTGDKHQW